MSAGLAISAGLKLWGALQARSQQRRAANAQAEIDAANLARTKEENKETLSRATSDVAAVEATGKTRSAGSGFAKGGVKTNYLERLSAVHKRDLDWLKQAQDSGVSIQQSEAAQRSRIAKANIDSTFLSGLGGAFSSGIKSYGRYQSTGDWWS